MEYDEYKEGLGVAIRLKRAELGYSQESFAGVCELHRTYVGAIERGERNISLENLVRISAALEISVSQLFDLVEHVK